jgi:hypothetical protein
MIRLPINLLVQKCGRELTKPKPQPETTTLSSRGGVRIHYVDFDKIRQTREREIELKTFPKGSYFKK